MSTDDPIPPPEPPKPDPPTPDQAEVDQAEVDPAQVDPAEAEQKAPEDPKAEPFEGASGDAASADDDQPTDPQPKPEPAQGSAVQPGSLPAEGKPRHAGDSARTGAGARAEETVRSAAQDKPEPAEEKQWQPEPVASEPPEAHKPQHAGDTTRAVEAAQTGQPGEVPDHPAAPTPMPRPRTPNLALRRLKSGFKPSRGQAIVAVVLALVACVAVVQVRVNRADDGYQNARREDLIAILDGLGQNTRRLESEITELEARKNTLSSSADKAQTAREQAEQQVRVLGILAGTLPAQGPGVRITLNDPDGKMTSSNLLDAIEELRDAGAEAIQINGAVRVVASTDLIDDAPGVKVDGEKVGSPYVIEAIGESHNLAEAANFPGGLVSEVTGPQIGGTAEVVELPSVQITALHAPDEHRYARPAPSPTK
ncbi:DUF881 domain-containing protein [Kribbella qitaiheensis]|uniref:DUF881 domain-containing protein n=1 Tax=Kribbella qitaiheensis TaxID=1544730 RepID=UPI0036236C33